MQGRHRGVEQAEVEHGPKALAALKNLHVGVARAQKLQSVREGTRSRTGTGRASRRS